jgi:Cu/Ag efflux protein CusF
LLAAVPSIASAQKPVTETEAVELTATIDAIDHDARRITLKDKSGATETVYAGPEIKRFDELKVGDTVTFRYYESMAYNIRKPGEASGPVKTGEQKVVRGTGPKPGGTVSRQETATVVIKEIDRKVPSVTVVTEDGRTASFKVNDKKNLEGVQVGDRVEMTYTVAMVISVK